MARLVLLAAFLSCLLGVFFLGTYKKYYDPKRSTRIAEELKKEANTHAVEHIEAAATDIGKELYLKKGQCFTCHGQNGEGNVAQLAPKLAAQHDWYILAQLKKMKAGERVNEKMNPFLKDLTEKDFEELAKFISTLK